MRKQMFIEVQGVRADIDKYGPGSPDGKGVDCGNKSERGYDNFIAGLDIQQESGHLERVGTRSSQQSLCHSQPLLQPGMTLACEGTVAGHMGIFDGTGDILKLVVDDR